MGRIYYSRIRSQKFISEYFVNTIDTSTQLMNKSYIKPKTRNLIYYPNVRNINVRILIEKKCKLFCWCNAAN